MDSVFYGFCGLSSICYVYISWYFEGCDIKVVPKDGISPMRLENYESELTVFWKLKRYFLFSHRRRVTLTGTAEQIASATLMIQRMTWNRLDLKNAMYLKFRDTSVFSVACDKTLFALAQMRFLQQIICLPVFHFIVSLKGLSVV